MESQRPLGRARTQQAASPVKPKRPAHHRSKTIGERYDPDSYPLSVSGPPLRVGRSSTDSSRRELRLEGSRSPILSVSAAPTSAQTSSPDPRSLHRNASVLSNVVTIPAPVPPIERQNTRDSVTDSLFDPQFIIPTEASMRRQKLKRVTKRLGDGVPMDLLFPDDRDEERCASPSVSCGSCTFTIVSGPRSSESGSDTSSSSSPISAYSHESFSSAYHDVKGNITHSKRQIIFPSLPLFRRGRSSSLGAASGAEHRKNFLDLTADTRKLRI